MTLREKDLEFDFNENYWTSILKFDETRDYQNAANNLPETKGVDIIGILQNQSLILFEIKDFRGHRIKNKPKFTDGPDALWLSVARKFKDSISIIIGSSRNSTNDKEIFQSYAECLKKNKQLVFILWLEQDTPLAQKNKKLKTDRQEHVLQQNLKKSLKWLTTKVNIMDKSINAFRICFKI